MISLEQLIIDPLVKEKEKIPGFGPNAEGSGQDPVLTTRRKLEMDGAVILIWCFCAPETAFCLSVGHLGLLHAIP